MPTPKQQIQTTIQLKNLVIKQDELKQLDNLIGNLPTRYGHALVNFLELVHKKRTLEALQRKQKIMINNK